jgi:hypothetical protein
MLREGGGYEDAKTARKAFWSSQKVSLRGMLTIPNGRFQPLLHAIQRSVLNCFSDVSGLNGLRLS